MFRPLLKKCWSDARWLLLATTAATVAFCWLRVWIVGQVDTSRFRAILDLLPADWQKFTPVDFEWLITYTGRIALAYDELIVVLCVSIWAVARGSDCVSGEIARGTLELTLAQPVSRIKWLWTHAGVTLCGVFVLSAAAWAGNWAGIQTTEVTEQVSSSWELPIPLPLVGDQIPLPFGRRVEQRIPMSQRTDAFVLIPASANLLALGVMLAGFSTLMSSWDRYRWRTIGIVVGVYVVELLIKITGMASSDWQWLLYLSAFSAYEPEVMVRIADLTPELTWAVYMPSESGDGQAYGPLAYHGVMLAVGLVCYALASVVFVRRDIPAPL